MGVYLPLYLDAENMLLCANSAVWGQGSSIHPAADDKMSTISRQVLNVNGPGPHFTKNSGSF